MLNLKCWIQNLYRWTESTPDSHKYHIRNGKFAYFQAEVPMHLSCSLSPQKRAADTLDAGITPELSPKLTKRSFIWIKARSPLSISHQVHFRGCLLMGGCAVETFANFTRRSVWRQSVSWIVSVKVSLLDGWTAAHERGKSKQIYPRDQTKSQECIQLPLKKKKGWRNSRLCCSVKYSHLTAHGGAFCITLSS